MKQQHTEQTMEDTTLVCWVEYVAMNEYEGAEFGALLLEQEDLDAAEDLAA